MEFLSNLLQGMAQNPAVHAIIVGFIVIAIGYIVKRTKTKKDDAIWEIVRGAMFNAFNIAEKMIPDSAGGGLKKVDEALKVFNNKVQDTLGRSATLSELEQAKAMWSEMAFELRKK